MEDVMPKATWITQDGSTVTIEGAEDEVAALLERLGGRRAVAAEPSGPAKPRSGRQKSNPMTLISELMDEGFFREPKELGAVRLALKERGHFYPVTTLSPLMLRLVRRKELRRIKEKNRWTYVG